jgi:CO/xanthine dehydrogenase Mo-binding subunit
MKKLGRGIASIIYPIGATAYSNPSNIIVKVTEEGRVAILTGTSEIGQGSDTILSQIAADEIGLPFQQVDLYSGDTRINQYDHGAGASRQTYIAGNATRIACAKVRDTLLYIAAELLHYDVSNLAIQEGFVILKNSQKRMISVAELAQEIYQEEIYPLPIAEGRYDPDVTRLDPETGQGRPFSMYTFATQIAEVEVDDQTGEVEVLRICAVHDVGVPINPMLAEGQVIGGVSMGLGYALMEEIIVDNQGVRNPNFVDYNLPTAMDMPDVKVKFIETGSVDKSGISKGIGEPATVPTAPAIANAIYDAIGVRITELPITTEKVWNAINAKRTQGGER